MIGSFDLTKISLVLGGARSGKSAMAEHLIRATGRPRHYIATAQIWDAEMKSRVAAHLAQRGPDWITHEAPRDLAPILAAIPAEAAVLIDCATLWLTNVLLAEGDIPAETEALIAACKACKAPVVLVSNEVGMGIVPENALARAFRDHQGRLNQRLAAEADVVLGVMAGLPFALKPRDYHIP
jgi:adenosylcobinamide kinase/adenosylcobinamide-phosphate guanylyltransferase